MLMNAAALVWPALDRNRAEVFLELTYPLLRGKSTMTLVLDRKRTLMATYFTPLRRKTGVGTLLIACVFAAVWIRGFAVIDEIWYDVRGHGKKWDRLFVSNQGYMLLRDESVNGVELAWRPDWQKRTLQPFETFENIVMTDFAFKKYGETVWDRKWNGFHFGERHRKILKKPHDRTLRYWVIPHWPIVIPLTLLSSWLLLSKPRQNRPRRSQIPYPSAIRPSSSP